MDARCVYYMITLSPETQGWPNSDYLTVFRILSYPWERIIQFQNGGQPQRLLKHRRQPNPRYFTGQAGGDEISGRNATGQVRGRLYADPRPLGHQCGKGLPHPSIHLSDPGDVVLNLCCDRLEEPIMPKTTHVGGSQASRGSYDMGVRCRVLFGAIKSSGL